MTDYLFWPCPNCSRVLC